MRMSPQEMYEQHCIHSLMRAVAGHLQQREGETQLLGEAMKAGWEQARFVAFYQINSTRTSEGDMLKTFTNLVVFPWEPEHEEWISRQEGKKGKTKQDIIDQLKGTG